MPSRAAILLVPMPWSGHPSEKIVECHAYSVIGTMTKVINCQAENFATCVSVIPNPFRRFEKKFLTSGRLH
jgi:hypothetical protein